MPKNQLSNTRFPNKFNKGGSKGANQGKVSSVVFKGKGGVYPGMPNPK